MKLFRTCLAVAAMAAVPLAAATAADTATRPSMYAPTSLGAAPASSASLGKLVGGSRVSARTTKGSALDDTGSTIIIAAAAAVGGYFLYDIVHDDHHNDNTPN